jgi:hypothetical protein
MFKGLLNLSVIMPVLLGVLAARSRRGGLARLVAFLLGYAVFHMLLLYYLRFRWVG